ncbi:type II secretion system protein [Candidatus Saccharibacteria bacterium]|nr:type II secretion system protein [Candidatus Saccharibacteria bacterium]
MSLQTLKDQKGFTIVELLIVIVVIGILAAITIVAFNGVQNRGKTSSSESAANTIVKKAEAANSLASSYPQDASGFSANKESSLTGSGITIVATAITAAPPAPGTVYIMPCSGTAGTGGRVTYWNFSTNAAVTKSYGEPTAAGTCAAGTAIAAGTF